MTLVFLYPVVHCFKCATFVCGSKVAFNTVTASECSFCGRVNTLFYSFCRTPNSLTTSCTFAFKSYFQSDIKFYLWGKACLIIRWDTVNSSSLLWQERVNRIVCCSFKTHFLIIALASNVKAENYEGASKGFRTGRLERELQWYSSLPLGAVVSLFYESV
jgi:hypothetical protein